jgi:hypothetical protein
LPHSLPPTSDFGATSVFSGGGLRQIGMHHAEMLRMYAKFSNHACERGVERLAMDLDEVGDLLDWNLAIKIGEEKGTHRLHRLFHSPEDRQCFIAIQDEKSKTVVTILPVDYYETLVAKIPPSLLAEAEQLVSCPAPAKPPEKPKEITVPPAAKPPEKANEITPPPVAKPVAEPPVLRSFKVIGTLMNVQGKSRTVNLGPWPAQDYENSTDQLLQDTRFLEAMRVKLNENASLEEYAVGLLIKLGKKDVGVWVKVD